MTPRRKIEDAIVKIRGAEQILQLYTYTSVVERAWQTIDEALDILAGLIIEKKRRDV